MIVPRSCRRSRHPGHAAIVVCRCEIAAVDQDAGASTKVIAKARNAA
jgi:hypothetical protein